MIHMDPDERLALIRKARADYDRARERLFRQISEALADGAQLPETEKRRLGPSAIGKAADFTREYIAKIRDGTHTFG
jgi:hypothetical protein